VEYRLWSYRGGKNTSTREVLPRSMSLLFAKEGKKPRVPDWFELGMLYWHAIESSAAGTASRSNWA
jgi:hypothetical protein